MTSPLTDYQLRHYRSLIERERTHAGETAAGILLAATLARLQHLERRLAQAEGALADIADSEDEHGVPSTREWMEQRARQALAACARIEGEEP
jgi:hypothetical protein